MYENENKNMNGLGNENMEHRDVPETTVNWTIPGDERNRQGQNTQGHRTMDPEARSQETQGQYSQARYSQAQEGQGSREQHREQHTQGPDAAFGSYGLSLIHISEEALYPGGGNSCSLSGGFGRHDKRGQGGEQPL